MIFQTSLQLSKRFNHFTFKVFSNFSIFTILKPPSLYSNSKVVLFILEGFPFQRKWRNFLLSSLIKFLVGEGNEIKKCTSFDSTRLLMIKILPTRVVFLRLKLSSILSISAYFSTQFWFNMPCRCLTLYEIPSATNSCTQSSSISWQMVSSENLLLPTQTALVLETLIFRPDASSYVLRMEIAFLKECFYPFRKSDVSSANSVNFSSRPLIL